jgi:hypothetical protein
MNAIRITSEGSKILSIELKDILESIADGDQYNWAILWLEFTGNIGRSVPEFEAEINKAPNGLRVDWNGLISLSKKIDQTIDLLLVGAQDTLRLRRYEIDEEMYGSCEYVIELIDSSYWIVHSKNASLLQRFRNNLSQDARISEVL